MIALLDRRARTGLGGGGESELARALLDLELLVVVEDGAGDAEEEGGVEGMTCFLLLILPAPLVGRTTSIISAADEEDSNDDLDVLLVVEMVMIFLGMSLAPMFSCPGSWLSSSSSSVRTVNTFSFFPFSPPPPTLDFHYFRKVT